MNLNNLLELREALIYWRGLQQTHPNITRTEAINLWIDQYAASYRARLASGWMPNLVTGYFDILPLSGLDLRKPALHHDISYLLAETPADRLRADRQLKRDIEALGGLYAGLVAAAVYRAVRLIGWSRVTYRSQSGGINGLFQSLTLEWM